MQNRLIAVAFILIAGAGVAGCGQAQTTPRKAARVTIDGATHTARPAACSQIQSYRTVDIGDENGHVEAVVALSGYRALPQWVQIHNFDGFPGSAYGINTGNPNKVVTTDFKITAEC